jgi:hypothetical protein
MEKLRVECVQGIPANIRYGIYTVRRNIFFSVLVYGLKTWSVILRGISRQRLLDDRRLRRIFEPKRDEVAVEFRNLLNEELCGVDCSRIITGIIK